MREISIDDKKRQNSSRLDRLNQDIDQIGEELRENSSFQSSEDCEHQIISSFVSANELKKRSERFPYNLDWAKKDIDEANRLIERIHELRSDST